MCFKRINLKLDKVLVHHLKGKLMEGYNNAFRSYHILSPKYLDYLCKDKIVFNIEPHYITITEILNYTDPHTDHNAVALNYYLEPSNCLTFFYEQLDDTEPSPEIRILWDGSWTTENHDVKTYKNQNLKIVNQFQAEDNSCYLLNVKCIHSVTKPQNLRYFIRWAWDDLTFDEVYNSIKIL